MGIVYQARDPKLNRLVAIKVLPAAVAGDSASVARFRREATLLATLNHPNIASIHSVEEGDGQQLLVLEYVPGPTLADVLSDPAQTSNGRLPLPQVLSIAAQIASALEAAHEQGIVHRDLKPANIKIRDDGTVKVLDFGLAKSLTRDDEQAAGGTDSPTKLTMTGTAVGVILGTAAYMSPEQARGKAVDKRADLWAFGVVLYEMLTGARLFAGETMTDVIASVVTREPDWGKLPPETPVPFKRLLRRCLQKDPRKRLRDASDARFEIEDAQSGVDEPSGPGTSAPPVRAASRRSPWLIAAAVSLLAIGAVLGFLASRTRPDAPSKLRRLSVAVPGLPTTEALSPDGAWLVARQNGRIQVRRIDQSDWRELPGTDDSHYDLFWSPDSRYIGFASGPALKKVDLTGSRAQTICDACLVTDLARGGAWSPSGVILVGGTGGGAWPGGIRMISADGKASDLTQLNQARGENSHRYPTFLPDGRHFLFAVRRDNGEHEIQLSSIDGQEPRVVTPAFSRMVYRDGYLFFARGHTLLAQPFDPGTALLSGTPTTLATNVRHTIAVAETYFSVATDGTLAYASAQSFSGGIWLGRDGRRLATAIDDSIDETLRASPDGRRIAAAVQDPDKASTDIVVIDAASGARSRLTSHPLWDQNPVWSPDGKEIAYRGTRDVAGIYVQDAAGGNERLVARDPGQMQRPLDWSPDGTLLASRANPRSTELVLIPIAGGPAVRLAETSASNARFSPDGRFVAYASLETGSLQVHIRGVHQPIGVRVTTAGGTNPVWSRDGRELFYIDHERWIAAVRVRTTAGKVEVGAATKLMPRGEGTSSAGVFAFDVDRSGRFLMRMFEDDSRAGDRTMLNVIQNWKMLIAK